MSKKDNHLILLKKGHSYYDTLKYKEAIVAYKEAIQIKPDYEWAYLNMGLAYDKLGQLEKAITAFKEAIKINPNYSGAYFFLGDAYKSQGQQKKAKEAYKNTIRLKEDDKYAHFNIGQLYKEEGSTAEAKYHFKRAIELGHERAKTALESLLSQEKVKPVFRTKTIRNDHLRSFNRGNAFYFAGEFEKAIKSYKEAIRIKPNYERAYFVLGEVYKSNGQRNEAKEAFVNALRFKSNDNITHFNLGLLYKEEGNTEKARYHINQALILGHKKAQAVLESISSQEQIKPITKPKLKLSRFENHFNKANILLDKGKIKEAVFLFKEAIPNEPNADPNTYLPKSYHNPGNVHFCLGLQHEKNGNLKKAGYHFVLAVQIGNAPAKAVYEWMNKCNDLPISKQKIFTTLFNEAVGLQNDGKFKEAIKAFKEFLDMKPNYALAYYFLGECYGEMGQSAKAIQAFKEALNIEEQDQWTHFKLGLEYKKERNISEAKFHFKRAMDLGYETAKNQLDNLESQSIIEPDKNRKIHQASLIRTLVGHTDPVNACTVSPDGSFVVSAAGNMMKILGHKNDNTVKVWDFKTGAVLFTLSGHNEAVQGCAVSKDGALIISVSEDCMKVWTTETGKELNRIETSGFACSACTAESEIVVVSLFIDVLDLASRKVRISILTDDLLHDCAISTDGSIFVTAGTDQHLVVWNVKDGEKITELCSQNESDPFGDVRACAISPDSKFIVSGGEDGVLKVWDTASFQEITVFKGHIDWITGCAIHPDNSRVVSSSEDGTLKIWSVLTGHNLITLKGHTGAVNACVFSPCGKYVISAGDDKTVKIWDVSE